MYSVYFSGRVLEYPQFGVVFSSAEQVKQLLIVQFKEGDAYRELLDILQRNTQYEGIGSPQNTLK